MRSLRENRIAETLETVESSLGAGSLDVLDYPDFGQKLTSEALLDRFAETELVADARPYTFRQVGSTAIGPTDWRLEDTPSGPSLTPSVGNWQQPCRSHYWIRNNHVLWSDQWSKGKVDTLKQREAERRDFYFGLGQERPLQKRGTNKPDKGSGRRWWFW